MSKDVEPFKDKDSYLLEFETLRPDIYFPQDWSPETAKKASEMVKSAKVKTAMFASIPMVCKGPNCVFAAVCPFEQQNMAPINRPCPIEMGIVKTFMDNYMQEFGVHPNNLVEVSMVRDLVDFEVQYMRATKTLAQEHFIAENPVGVDSEGNVIIRKELHQAVEYEDKILKRKEKLLNAFLATREARTKAGQGLLDASQQIANLRDQVVDHMNEKDRLLLIKMGRAPKDAYIESDIAEAEIVDDGEL